MHKRTRRYARRIPRKRERPARYSDEEGNKKREESRRKSGREEKILDRTLVRESSREKERERENRRLYHRAWSLASLISWLARRPRGRPVREFNLCAKNSRERVYAWTRRSSSLNARSSRRVGDPARTFALAFTLAHEARPAEEHVTDELRYTLEPRVCVFVWMSARDRRCSVGGAHATAFLRSWPGSGTKPRNMGMRGGLILSGENKYPSLCASG